MPDIDVQRVLAASLMAVAAMASLILGTIIGLFARPSQRLNAIIMAFGTGALIQALALQLAQEGALRLMHHAHLNGIEAWLWVAFGFSSGGVLYYVANRLVDTKGGALRHPALAKLYILNKKREESSAILKQLSKVELVRSLPPEDMEGVLQCVEPVQFKKNDVIFRRGDPGDALYFINEGKIEILSGNGKQTDLNRLAVLSAGQSFGEMALLTGEPRSATAVAVDDASLLKIGKTEFDALIEASHSLRRAVENLTSQRILQNVQKSEGKLDAQHWQKIAVANIQRISKSEELTLMQKHASAGAPLAIFLGAMMDGIPESIVIGSSFVSFETYKFTFLAAVFLSNLPEAIASSIGMHEAGFSSKKIFGLWGSLVIFGAIASAIGNLLLPSAPHTLITLVEAIAGGGILAMVASVMMPEAYEHGGPEVGLATIAGFLCAFLFTLL